MNLLQRTNRPGDKIFFYYDFGRGKNQRPSTGIFIYKNPKDQVQKNHNKEALRLLEIKKSQVTLESQASGTGFIPAHRIKTNFIDYYEEYVDNNKRKGNRHLENSLKHFKSFLNKDFLAPIDITENLCIRFRQYLLDHFTGDTPANYYARFKRVIKAATKEGYYRTNPCEDLKAKSNPSIHLKENLEANEYIKLLQTPCLNTEVQEAFIFCCYTALRYVDVDLLEWRQINDDLLKTQIIQKKTGQPMIITLHSIAKTIIDKRSERAGGKPKGKVFNLPTHNGCNKVLRQWVKNAGIKKHITWHCARLSFSILLQDKNVDAATVSLLLGQTTSKYVQTTYKRHRLKDQTTVINKLPMPGKMPSFLH